MIQQTDPKQEYRVLARKYRPQTLSDLKGQEILSTTLKKAIAEGRIPHAFLFHGIRGIGKTTTARILAKALNCKGMDGQGNITCDPCGKCSSCIAIQEDRHLDVIEMDAASHTGVDDIREIIDSCRYKAVQGRYKVFIIDEVHMLSKNAFNALLKTLEEPPAHVKFIFATTELRKIPDTILSRCQRFDLKRMDQPLLIAYLNDIATKEGFSSEPLALSVLARAADGSMRDGISLLDQAISLTQANNTTTIQADIIRNMLGQADRGMVIDLMEHLLSGNVKEGIACVRNVLTFGTDHLILMQDVLEFVYALTTYQTQKIKTDLGFSEQEQSRFLALAQKVSSSILLQSWQILIRGYEELVKSPLQNETLEMVLIRLCYVLPLTSLSHTSAINLGTTAEEKKDFITFEQVIDALQNHKEMMLHTHCRHDAHILHFENGKIVMRMADNVPKTFVTHLKNFLEIQTDKKWNVELVQTGGANTLVQQKQDDEKNLETAAKAQPIAKKILDAFPDSKTTLINNNNA
jgi:DNA polymerase-3 subunit gamma/tau